MYERFMGKNKSEKTPDHSRNMNRPNSNSVRKEKDSSHICMNNNNNTNKIKHLFESNTTANSMLYGNIKDSNKYLSSLDNKLNSVKLNLFVTSSDNYNKDVMKMFKNLHISEEIVTFKRKYKGTIFCVVQGYTYSHDAPPPYTRGNLRSDPDTS